MLDGKSEIPYPKCIAEYAKLVSSNNSKLEEEIRKFEEQDYFSNIGLDLVKATTIAKLFFNDVTKNIVNSDNRYLYEAFSQLLIIPQKSGEIKVEFIENSLQIILRTISEEHVSEAFYLFLEKIINFFVKYNNDRSSICEVINGFIYSDRNLKDNFESVAKTFEKIFLMFENRDIIFECVSKKLVENKYIKQINDLIINNNEITQIDLMVKEEQTLVTFLLNQNKKDEGFEAIITYLNQINNSYPKLNIETNKMKLFFTTFNDDMSNFENFNFDCLKVFFEEQEIDFFKNISIGFSLLHSCSSKTDNFRQFIFKLSLKIMRYASTELYTNSLKYFEMFLSSAEVESNAIQKDASLRKNVALKCFMFYNDKIDNVMQKILNAKCVSDVLESYLDYIDLSSGKSIEEIHKIESILSQFLSIEPLIKIKKFYSIWPYFIYISHLKQNNNEKILNISNSLKVLYNFPNFINGLTCIKQLIIYLIDDQKNGVEMSEFSDKALKLEQSLKNKNSLTLNTLGGLLFNDNRLNALNNALDFLKTDDCKNIQKPPKHNIPVLIGSRF
jgi:hypothetical protein